MSDGLIHLIEGIGFDHWLDAMMALQGGAGASEEMDEEAEPMEIICYQLP